MAILSDNTLFAQLVLETERGNTLTGSYQEVLSVLNPEIKFNHFRALQLARVGRRWEDMYLTPFTDICPNLPASASDWNGI